MAANPPSVLSLSIFFHYDFILLFLTPMKMGLQCMTVVFKNELNLLMKRVFKFIDFPLNYFRNNVKQK